MNKTMYYTQEILFATKLFGKDYFWMKDVDGTIYLAKAVDKILSESYEPNGVIKPMTAKVPAIFE